MAHVAKKTFDLPNFGPGLTAHRLVMEVAVGLAHELYEEVARNNATYRALRASGQISDAASRLVFVERMAPRLLEDARQALADLLTQPDKVVSRKQKDEIADALILDTDLRANRFVAEDQATIPTSLH